jgi:AcrR family transcriptional regulator
MSRRDRLLAEGMRLFGEKGYAATSVAEIEEAAGLARGSGSLYRHFRSKRELLEAGVDAVLRHREPADVAPDVTSVATPDVSTLLGELARRGLERMHEDRDLNRLLLRGLEQFPRLLRRFVDGEIMPRHEEIAAALESIGGEKDLRCDWDALACVVQGAAAHYWLISDIFDGHPGGTSEEDYVTALVALTASALEPPDGEAGRGSRRV